MFSFMFHDVKLCIKKELTNERTEKNACAVRRSVVHRHKISSYFIIVTRFFRVFYCQLDLLKSMTFILEFSILTICSGKAESIEKQRSMLSKKNDNWPHSVCQISTYHTEGNRLENMYGKHLNQDHDIIVERVRNGGNKTTCMKKTYTKVCVYFMIFYFYRALLHLSSCWCSAFFYIFFYFLLSFNINTADDG